MWLHNGREVKDHLVQNTSARSDCRFVVVSLAVLSMHHIQQILYKSGVLILIHKSKMDGSEISVSVIRIKGDNTEPASLPLACSCMHEYSEWLGWRRCRDPLLIYLRRGITLLVQDKWPCRQNSLSFTMWLCRVEIRLARNFPLINVVNP